MTFIQSKKLHERATKQIVGGVNSPSRSYASMGMTHPIYMERGKEAHLWDVDGNEYIDYLGAFGPIITGHAHPHIQETITRTAATGTLYGTPTESEISFCEKIQQAIPSMERMRLVNSGTEGVMSAIRLARAYTNRSKIIKFAGCYHGHSDLVLVAAGSGPSTLGIPDSAGIPNTIAEEVITVPYNDKSGFQQAMERWGDETAAVLVEPIVGNFGIVQPEPGFLEYVQTITAQSGALLVFDEVITAFRFHYGAAQNMLGIEPDITVLGKIIGGGLPIGAYGGKASIMELVAPEGPAYQAGTMAGNPLSVAAGIACLEVLEDGNGYDRMNQYGALLENGIQECADKHGIHLCMNRLGGALTIYFGISNVQQYDDVQRADDNAFAAFFRGMLSRGILLAPSKYEAWFLTIAHTEVDIDRTLEAVDQTFTELPQSRK